MKTAISIPDDIFKDIDRISKDRRCSRSQILTEAAREYIERQRNRKIFEALNKAYEDEETVEERKVRTQSKKRYTRLAKKDTW